MDPGDVGLLEDLITYRPQRTEEGGARRHAGLVLLPDGIFAQRRQGVFNGFVGKGSCFHGGGRFLTQAGLGKGERAHRSDPSRTVIALRRELQRRAGGLDRRFEPLGVFPILRGEELSEGQGGQGLRPFLKTSAKHADVDASSREGSGPQFERGLKMKFRFGEAVVFLLPFGSGPKGEGQSEFVMQGGFQKRLIAGFDESQRLRQRLHRLREISGHLLRGRSRNRSLRHRGALQPRLAFQSLGSDLRQRGCRFQLGEGVASGTGGLDHRGEFAIGVFGEKVHLTPVVAGEIELQPRTFLFGTLGLCKHRDGVLVGPRRAEVRPASLPGSVPGIAVHVGNLARRELIHHALHLRPE